MASIKISQALPPPAQMDYSMMLAWQMERYISGL
jgi:hypothetical protein